jgi:hypothetical protein
MSKLKFNFSNFFNFGLRRFNNDLKEAVLFDGKNVLKKRTKEKFLFGLFVFLFILSKPFYNQYSAKLIRIEKIRKLKEEGLYILD